jgi:poly-gamma-glutamate capsule biosynthesis protein CapA/YwtB (metallophosphatase superfamily)
VPSTPPAAVPTPTRLEPSLDYVPLVPVVSFWSTERSVSRTDLRRALTGYGTDPLSEPRPLAIGTDDLPGLEAILGLEATSTHPSNVETMAAADVIPFVKATPGALGIVRADDVALGIRAIGVDGVALFGIGRTTILSEWPLMVVEPGIVSEFDASRTWTMAAGGDVMLDKAVYANSVLNNYGVDYAWDGGTAEIGQRYCCGWGGQPLAQGTRTGNTGAFAWLFDSADLSLVNLESPEPNNFRYHSDGFEFTGDPDLLAGLQHAGIDMVSLANNHIGNGGSQGILDTIDHLDQLGIAHAGAGANRAAARQAAWLLASGWRVAVLAYSWVEPTDYWATDSSPGSAGYSIAAITADIAAVKAQGADYVIVMPHWGIEYTDSLVPGQQDDARRMIAAGADLILGSHSHWFGPVQQLGPDNLVFYSLGDLVFDWTHDERTQESAVVDLTFAGRRLVQVDLHPTLIIGGQPNLLDPATDGQTVLGQVRATSQSLLGW